MTKKTALNEPIVLSGRVYLAGFLAQEVSGFDLPATLRAGDIKLHNVPKAGKRQRYGQAVEIGYRQREPGNIVIDFVKKQ